MNEQEAMATIAHEYSMIGYLYYKRHKNDPDPELKPYVEAITALTAMTSGEGPSSAVNENQQDDADKALCPECGSENDRSARFCRKCGTPQSGDGRGSGSGEAKGSDGGSEPGQSSEAVAARPESESAGERCPYCNSGIPAGAPVCSTCGSPLK